MTPTLHYLKAVVNAVNFRCTPEDMAVLEELGLAQSDPQGGPAQAASTDPQELSTHTDQTDWSIGGSITASAPQ